MTARIDDGFYVIHSELDWHMALSGGDYTRFDGEEEARAYGRQRGLAVIHITRRAATEADYQAPSLRQRRGQEVE